MQTAQSTAFAEASPSSGRLGCFVQPDPIKQGQSSTRFSTVCFSSTVRSGTCRSGPPDDPQSLFRGQARSGDLLSALEMLLKCRERFGSKALQFLVLTLLGFLLEEADGRLMVENLLLHIGLVEFLAGKLLQILHH